MCEEECQKSNPIRFAVAAGIKGEDVLDLSQRLVKTKRSYTPDPKNKDVYERNYRVVIDLYKSNAANYKRLNS